MFCHERYSLLGVFEKKIARSYQHVRGNDGSDQREEGEKAHRWPPNRRGACRDRGKEGIHLPLVWPIGHPQRGIRRSSRSDTSRPARCSISTSHHPAACILTIAVSLWPRQKGRRAGSRRLAHSRRRTAKRSCLMSDTREMKASMVTSVSLFEQETGWS